MVPPDARCARAVCGRSRSVRGRDEIGRAELELDRMQTDLLTALAAAGFDQQRGRALLRKLRRQGVIVSEQPAADSGCPRNQVVWKLPGGGEAGAGGVEGSRPRGSAEVASD